MLLHPAVLVQGVDILTFGQYLQPTPLHLPVKEQVTPEQFEHWRKFGEEVVGFRSASCSHVCIAVFAASVMLQVLNVGMTPLSWQQPAMH